MLAARALTCANDRPLRVCRACSRSKNMDPEKLAALQAQLAKGGHDHAAAPAPGACTKPGPIEDLERTTSVLNATNVSAIATVMGAPVEGAEPLRSDADEQVNFRNSCVLSSSSLLPFSHLLAPPACGSLVALCSFCSRSSCVSATSCTPSSLLPPPTARPPRL